MTAPPISPKTFPYRRKWTKEQLDEILDRKDRLVEAMTDAVGPTGQMLYLPPDMVHIMALHIALAGGEVREELAYIVSRLRPAGEVMFADTREWLLKQEYKPGPAPADETAAKAKAAADQIRRQLTPEVTAALTQILADGFNAQAHNNITTSDQVDDAQQVEDEMRDQAREDGER